LKKHFLDNKCIYPTSYKFTEINLRDIPDVESMVEIFEMFFGDEVVINLDQSHLDKLSKLAKEKLGL